MGLGLVMSSQHASKGSTGRSSYHEQRCSKLYYGNTDGWFLKLESADAFFLHAVFPRSEEAIKGSIALQLFP
jgi:hypothetical protein